MNKQSDTDYVLSDDAKLVNYLQSNLDISNSPTIAENLTNNQYWPKTNSFATVDFEHAFPNFRKTSWRWALLVFACLMLFGDYFCYDNPNALSDMLKEKVTHDSKNEIKYDQLYSVYSYPNIILPVFAGILVDKIGLYVTTMIFLTFMLIGQIIFALSGFLGNDDQDDNFPYHVALAGRFIFGLGGEAILVWKWVLIGKWFHGQELSLALGVVLSVSRAGSSVNNYILPTLEKATSLGVALSLGVLFWIISLISGIIVLLLERHARKVGNEKNIKVDPSDKFRIKDIKELNFSYWMLIPIAVWLYIGWFWFGFISNNYFRYRYGFNQTEAGIITSNIYLISAFSSPLIGAFWDKFGHKLNILWCSKFLLALSHLLYLIIPSSYSNDKTYYGIIPVIVMGVAYSMFVTTINPLIILSVKPRILGSAFGLFYMFPNLAMATVPLFVGAITVENKGVDRYFWVNITLWIFSFIGFIWSLILYVYDKIYQKSNLNSTNTEPPKNESKDYESVESIVDSD